jgi:hypothetical protein
LLTTQLGFIETGEVEIPPVEPPRSMRRNADGQVVGDLFRFQVGALDAFADWIESFDGVLYGKGGQRTRLTIESDVVRYRAEVVSALRDRARR